MKLETLDQLNAIVDGQKTIPDEVFVDYDEKFSLIWKVTK